MFAFRERGGSRLETLPVPHGNIVFSKLLRYHFVMKVLVQDRQI